MGPKGSSPDDSSGTLALAPRFGRMDGIVDGRVGDVAAAQAAVRKANESGYARLSLEVDGGRFSILPDAARIPAGQMTDARRAAFFEGLCDFVAACDGPAESTLRCTEVFDLVVRETLFLTDPGERSLRAWTRERPVTAQDHSLNPGDRVIRTALPKSLMVMLVALVIVATGLLAWTGGWIDRGFSADAANVRTDTSVFGDLLSFEVKGSWGDYVVSLRRGRSYPLTLDDIERLRQTAGQPARRVAVDVVSGGDPIWLRLEDKDGRGLAASRIDLRSLVESKDDAVSVRLPGRRDAARIRLALSAGEVTR
jgi:hypothetical protein